MKGERRWDGGSEIKIWRKGSRDKNMCGAETEMIKSVGSDDMSEAETEGKVRGQG